MDPCDNINVVCISPFLIVLACFLSAGLGWVMRGDEKEGGDDPTNKRV